MAKQQFNVLLDEGLVVEVRRWASVRGVSLNVAASDLLRAGLDAPGETDWREEIAEELASVRRDVEMLKGVAGL